MDPKKKSSLDLPWSGKKKILGFLPNWRKKPLGFLPSWAGALLTPHPEAKQFQTPGKVPSRWNSCFGNVRTPGQRCQALGAGGIPCLRGSPGCVQELREVPSCRISLSQGWIAWRKNSITGMQWGMLVMEWRDVLCLGLLVFGLHTHTRCEQSDWWGFGVSRGSSFPPGV